MSDEMTTHERLAAWLDGEAALYRERARRAEDAQDWDPAVRYAGAADALVQLRDRVLLGEQIGPSPGQNGGLAAPEPGISLLRTPRGEGERVQGAWATVEAAALARADLLDSNFAGQRAQAAEIRNAVAHVAAFLRAPRGEGEASGLAECIITCMGCGQDFDANDDAQARYHEAACEVVDYEPARVEIARRLRGAALRSDAQGEEERR